MSDQKTETGAGTGTKVAIVVAVIGLLGTLGGAVITNLDKFGGGNSNSGNGGGGELETTADSYPANMGPLELHTNRQGSDFSPNAERVESPEDCARLCGKTGACRAMTFVGSPNNLPGGTCWLKYAIPSASPRDDMTSAIKLSG